MRRFWPHLAILLRGQFIRLRREEHDAPRVSADGKEAWDDGGEADPGELLAHLAVAEHQRVRHLHALRRLLDAAQPQADAGPVDTEGRAGAVEAEPLGRLGLELGLALGVLLLLEVRRQLQRHLAQELAARRIPQGKLAIHTDRRVHFAIRCDAINYSRPITLTRTS